MSKRNGLLKAVLAVALGGSVLQFGIGGCNPLMAIIGLAAAPALLGGGGFGGLFGGSTTGDQPAGQEP